MSAIRLERLAGGSGRGIGRMHRSKVEHLMRKGRSSNVNNFRENHSKSCFPDDTLPVYIIFRRVIVSKQRGLINHV